MVDFGKSVKMIRISGKPNTYNGFSSNISFKEEVWISSFLNKERNITTKPVGSGWFIHLFLSYIYIHI